MMSIWIVMIHSGKMMFEYTAPANNNEPQVFGFTNAYYVFDWGKSPRMPKIIENIVVND